MATNNLNSATYFTDSNTNDKQIKIDGTGISLTKDLLTSPITAQLNQNGVTVGINSSTWQNLALLDDVLASVEYPPNPQTLLLNNTVVLDDLTNTNTTTITNYHAIFNDINTNMEVEINNNSSLSTEPYIRMQNSIGISNYYNQSNINADGNHCFTFNNNEKFFKQNNPFSFLNYELNDGDYIEKHMPFIFIQNVNYLKLYNKDR
jgi:hypothetical protein